MASNDIKESYKLILEAAAQIEAGSYYMAEELITKAKILNPNVQISHLNSITNQFEQSALNGSKINATAAADDATHKSLQQLINKINCTEDPFKILDLEANATSVDIKKSYKKLALRLHPDKSQAIGSIDAFKKVNYAFNLLSNEQNRLSFYRPAQANKTTMHSFASDTLNGSKRRKNIPKFRCQNEAENIFNDTRKRVYVPANQRKPTYIEKSKTVPIFVTASTIFLILLYSLSDDKPYRFQESAAYSKEYVTTRLGISFYVKKDYVTKNKDAVLKRLENAVETEYVMYMKSRCYAERMKHEEMLLQTRKIGDILNYRRAKNVRLPSCDRLIKLGLLSGKTRI